MRLYVIRHGQTEWNQTGLAQGHTDIPLDKEGLRQAQLLSRGFISDFPTQIVYSSDLLRCRQTAEPLAERLGAELRIDPRLREQGFGELEGQHYLKVREALTGMSAERFSDFRPTAGESLRDMWLRVGEFARELLVSEDPAVVVTHGGSGGALLSHALRGNVETARGFRFGNTGVSELERRSDGSWVLVRLNDTSHLTSDEPVGTADGKAH